MNTRKVRVCPHCRELVNTMRGVGNVMGAEAEHYLMAAVVGAQDGGETLEATIAALRQIWHAEQSERGDTFVGVDVGVQDVSVVAVVPVNAIDAFVASLGEQPA